MNICIYIYTYIYTHIKVITNAPKLDGKRAFLVSGEEIQILRSSLKMKSPTSGMLGKICAKCITGWCKMMVNDGYYMVNNG